MVRASCSIGIIMKEIEKLSKQAEKIISEVMIIDYNKAA